MRPTSFDPSRWASTSTGTTTRSPERSTVNSSVLPGCGCTCFTSAGKSATGVPPTATIRSPTARPARSAGLPGCIVPISPARSGTRTRTRGPAAVRRARSAPRAAHDREWRGPGRAVGRTHLERDGAAIHQLVEDCEHDGLARAGLARSDSDDFVTVASPPSPRSTAARPPPAPVSGPECRRRRAPVRGGSKEEIREGPGEQYEDPLPDGLAVIGRGESAVATGPSRSSRSLT